MDFDLRTLNPSQLKVFLETLIGAVIENTLVTGVYYRDQYYKPNRRLNEHLEEGGTDVPAELLYQLQPLEPAEMPLPEDRPGAPPALRAYIQERWKHACRFKMRPRTETGTVDPSEVRYEFKLNWSLYPHDEALPAHEAILELLKPIDPTRTRIHLDRPLVLKWESYAEEIEEPDSADLLPIRLPHERVLTLPAYVEVLALAEALIRLKACHFSNIAELFTRIQLEVTEEQYVVTVRFD